MSIESERPIVITGGSVDIAFADTFDPIPNPPPGAKKFQQRNGAKKITTITVTIDGGEPQVFNVSNGKCEVTVEYR